ncbi:hypothetical protein CONPUDRAFT_73002 [Coniophora puteana RWD-64-598 SS2]|uniref:Uncharacterized protein n=1 Tax=Coniophora puteana (strain RWD-64-598) TaxID=741705 RepID=A0A5M3MPV3_CONPW|nr:uncharacterized protein CONPUDRAFT_73002 [Coniophora puteana RWD-64-598 SS2]EIW81212.1 hypothetical protein CONPUDRAFT_73002 [Coniophora puteana RWD-64-598 SS2]
MSNNVTVDDEDPGMVYSLSSIAPQWNPLGERTRHKGSINKGGGIRGAFDGTLTGTSEAGATATFSFNGITVYGAYGPIPNNITGVSTTTPPISNYTIDSGTPVSFSVDLFPTAAVFGQQFFATDTLSGDAEHTLVITNVQDGAWLWIDDLVFTPYDVAAEARPAYRRMVFWFKMDNIAVYFAKISTFSQRPRGSTAKSTAQPSPSTYASHGGATPVGSL